MQWLEDFANDLTDQDWGWWPFLFLRPEQNEVMDIPHVARMTTYFGPFFSIILVVFFYFLYELNLTGVLMTVVGFHIFFFVGYNLTFAIAWNRRAKRLQQQGK